MKIKYLLFVLLVTLIKKSLSINFVLTKSKVYVASDSQYISNVEVHR